MRYGNVRANSLPCRAIVPFSMQHGFEILRALVVPVRIAHCALGRQSRSKQVSGRNLLKMGMFRRTAADFSQFDVPKRPNGKVETRGKSAKVRRLRPLPGFAEGLPGSADCLAGVGGIESPNGGIKIRGFRQRFQRPF